MIRALVIVSIFCSLLSSASATIVTSRCSSSGDDVSRWGATAIDLTDIGVAIGNDGDRNKFGLRFPNVAIPPGTVIDSAKIKFRATTNQSGTVVRVVLKAWAGDSMRTFTGLPYNGFDSLTRGTDSLVWSSLPSWTDGSDYETPPITAMIQKVINRAGFKSGNAIGVFVNDNTSTLNTAIRFAMSYDGSATSAPQLEIWFGGGIPPSVPTLIAPANQSTGQAVSLALSWKPSSGALSYRLQLSTSSNFSTILRDTSGVIDTTLSVGKLANNTTYYWRVAAWGTTGSSLFSPGWSFTTVPLSAGTMAPLNVSPSGRYLQAAGSPVFLNGDAEWSLIGQLTYAQADAVLTDRASRGFNAVLVNLIEHRFADRAPNNINNIAPFTTANQFFTANEAYFAFADSIIARAGVLGIYVFLDATYLGSALTTGAGHTAYEEGWRDAIYAQTPAQLKAWGSYVGNRYKNFPNVVWVIGGDANADTAGVRPQLDSFVVGLQSSDTIYTGRVITGHGDIGLTRTFFPEGWLSLNGIYSYSYSQDVQLAQTAYASNPTLPFIWLEGNYEVNNTTTPIQLRSQAYWTVLRGGCGAIFGNCPIWYMGASSDGSCGQGFASVQANLGSVGSVSMTQFNNLFTSRHWYNLTPDINGTVLTAGSSSGTDFGLVAYAADSTTIIGYFPSQRTVSIDPGVLKGDSIAVTWISCSDGVSTPIGSLTKVARNYAPPAAGDWVLVVDGNMKTVTIPSAPTLASPANGAIGIPTTPVLTWNASSGATSYRLLVSTDSLFRTSVVDKANIASTAYTVSGLAANFKYYWRVNASNTAGTSVYSTSWNFVTQVPAPSAPTLSSPTAGATGIAVNPTLSWNASANATSYRLQLSTDSAFVTSVVDQSNITSTSLAVTGLAANTSYYWHVNASNAGATSPYSASWNFTTAGAAPVATLLTTRCGSSGDDVSRWGTTTIDLTDLGVAIGNDGDRNKCGLRFPNVAIPRGTVIDSAKIKFRATASQAGKVVNVVLKAWAGDSMRSFAGLPYKGFDSLTRGADSLVWSSLPSWTGGSDYETPAITALIQKVINRTGFKSGNAIGIFLNDNASTLNTAIRFAQSYDGSSAFAPQLEIWYKSTGQAAASAAISSDYASSGQLPRPSLIQNRPNPFNPTTRISFDLPNPCDVKLEIYNILGERVRVLLNAPMGAGTHDIDWNSKDDYGQTVASGIYLYRLSAGDYVGTKKMVLEK